MHTYYLRFVLHTYQATLQQIKTALAEFGTAIDIAEDKIDAGIRGRQFRIALDSDDPTLIFDTCAHFGRIKQVKVEEKK
jgi:hypothetical protein